jgi:dynein heavy chain
MAMRCGDIYEVIEIMEQFYSIFGPELKAVTGDPQQIDEVIKRIEGLMVPIEMIPFDVFNKKFQSQWESVISKFREQILQIEDMAKQFINASFKKLRSAEGAFDLLLNIKNIKSREAINNLLMQKFNDILEQYSKEVDIISEMFTSSRLVCENSLKLLFNNDALLLIGTTHLLQRESRKFRDLLIGRGLYFIGSRRL